ncbi:MAG: DNA recombination protein RmuC [Bacteroidales bacterium]|nr:DNA recombination protein RmuC [Bacteroidales bacterium]
MEILWSAGGLVVGVILTFLFFYLRQRSIAALTKEKHRMYESALDDLKLRAESKENALFDLNGEYNAQLAENKNLKEKLELQKAELGQLQEKFTHEFKNLANEILEEKTKKFTEQNRSNLDEVLKPLSEKIKDFEKKVEDTYEKGLKDQTALQAELKKLHELNYKISEEAHNLTLALKGDVKKQGNWGEVVLERILESSGLQKGREYELQVAITSRDGNRQVLDALVYLPDKKNIIIDSKVSLVAYDSYVGANDEEDRKQWIKEHIKSIRNHIKELSQKKYQTAVNINAPEYVLMFIPIEASFSVAVSEDREIFNEAWNSKIVIVSPSTLIASLMTIASIWKQENQTRNAMEIARQGGNLYDKFEGLLQDLIQLGKKLDDTQQFYRGSMNKLHTGKGNLIHRIETLRLLGATNTKSLPQELIDRSKEGEEEE